MYEKSFPILLIIFTILAFGAVSYNVVHVVLAGAGSSAAGWAWSGSESFDDGIINGNESGMGWISMNSSDCDIDNNGIIDDPACGAVGGPIANYGVNIPNVDGPLSGYGWSEHLGWISFNGGADLIGCSPALTDPTRSTNILTGGARILSIRDAGSYSGGYDGCISLSGASYGVVIAGNVLSGYAWSSDIGWIDFTGINIGALPSVSLSAVGCNNIPAGSDECTGSLNWTFFNGVAPYSVINTKTGFLAGITVDSGGDVPVILKFGPNRIEAKSAHSLVDYLNVNALCVAGTVWNGTTCELILPPPVPPSITVSADPNIIRSESTATINIEIHSSNPLACSLIDAQNLPVAFAHAGTPETNNYSFTTSMLTSSKMVTVECTDTVSGLIGTGTARIDVIPTVQEI